MPEKTATAALVAPQAAEQLDGVQGAAQQQFLLGRQHQFAQLTVLDQVQCLLDAALEGLLPGITSGHQPWQVKGGWGGLVQGLCLFPEGFRHGSGRDAPSQAALMQEPAVTSLAPQLPTGEHDGDPWRPIPVGVTKKAEGQRQPWALHRLVGWMGAHQATQACIDKPLGQCKPSWSPQLQALLHPCGRQRQAWQSIPDPGEVVPLRQLGQRGKRIQCRHGNAKTEHPLFPQTLSTLLGHGQEAPEGHGGKLRNADQK